MTSPQYSHDPIRDRAVAWLLRLQAPACGEAERRACAAWLAQNPKHRQAFEAAQAAWDWMEPFKTQPFSARDAALNYRPLRKRRLGAYATAALLLLGVSVAALAPQGWLGTTATYSAAKGDKQTVLLADGSILELNTDSEIRVKLDYWRREVELLRGEAFFKVAHENRRPFVVHAGSGRIRDIGTAFEVYKTANQVLVAVQEGAVEVQTQTTQRLNAGQQLAYAENGQFISVPKQDIAALTAWRQGQLVFRAKRLDEVLAEAGRYHNQRIRLQDKRLAAMRVSGTFPANKLESLLNAVAAILPVRVEHLSNNEIVLQRVREGR